ncbi:hypothetical protein E0K89_014865 [Aquicoccus sp. SCR17]|nr:hypothetical protein [Carideicomes alvinocaridis]
MPDPALQIARPDRVLSASRQYRRPLGEILVDMGVLGPQQLMQALAIHGQCRAPIDRVCLAEGFVTEDQLLAAQSLQFGIRRLGPRDPGPDPSLVLLLPPEFCRDHALLPWSRDNGRLTLATSDPAAAEAALAGFRELREDVTLALLPERRLHREITRLHGPALAAAAETKVPEAESCRDFLRAGPGRTRVTALACALMALAVFLAPQMIFTLLALWAVLTMALSALLKLACLATMVRRTEAETDPPPPGGGPGARHERPEAAAATAPPRPRSRSPGPPCPGCPCWCRSSAKAVWQGNWWPGWPASITRAACWRWFWCSRTMTTRPGPRSMPPTCRPGSGWRRCPRAGSEPSRARSTTRSACAGARSWASTTPRMRRIAISFCGSRGRFSAGRPSWPASRGSSTTTMPAGPGSRAASPSNTPRGSGCSCPAWPVCGLRYPWAAPRSSFAGRRWRSWAAGMPIT